MTKKNPNGRPRKHLTEEALKAVADAVGQIGFMPDRVRVARLLVPLLAKLSEREPASIAAQFRDAYVNRMRQQWKVFGREWGENSEIARVHGERYFSAIMGLKAANYKLPVAV